ncbi:CPBP family intramembrane glutamic endopeptidase [Streptomyces sp. NPDC026672]|uniref:CPBP family intramembrane glutamic endopeptidase n=1 Tax=unclassified Streptomyces TaxID=2593676 RepID=UPI0033CE9C45
MGVESGTRDEGRLRRIVGAPLGWMLVGLVAVGLVSGPTAGGPGVVALLGAGACLLVYRAVMRYVARRDTPEIARTGARREALLGVGLGSAFVLGSTLVLTVFGGYSFSSGGHGFFAVVRSAVTVSAAAAIGEELMFRGLALQALEQQYGSRAALAITALFFGGAHLFNPGATVWSSLAIALEAGLLLGAAFLWRRSIWFVAGFHFAWNALEQLLGIPVSGHTAPGLLTARLHGPDLLTGGRFGLEASLVPVVVCVLLAVPMLARARRAGRLTARRTAA